eukprot:5487875-Ditylum_brightwellii.AAC.1
MFHFLNDLEATVGFTLMPAKSMVGLTSIFVLSKYLYHENVEHMEMISLTCRLQVYSISLKQIAKRSIFSPTKHALFCVAAANKDLGQKWQG